MARKFQVRI